MSRPKRKTKAGSVGARPCPVINGLPLTGAQERSWRMANEELASGDLIRIKRGMERLRGLEAELLERQAETELNAGLEDTLSLERDRGERIELSKPGMGPGAGRVRIRTRDGLETLARSGAINAVQLKAGLLYRQLYESTDPERDLRSRMDSLDRVGSSGVTTAGEAWQERRLRLASAMAVIEAKVRGTDRNGQAVRALREVAGHARCLSHFASGGGAQAAYREALVAALNVTADHFRLR